MDCFPIRTPQNMYSYDFTERRNSTMKMILCYIAGGLSALFLVMLSQNLPPLVIKHEVILIHEGPGVPVFVSDPIPATTTLEEVTPEVTEEEGQ